MHVEFRVVCIEQAKDGGLMTYLDCYFFNSKVFYYKTTIVPQESDRTDLQSFMWILNSFETLLPKDNYIRWCFIFVAAPSPELVERVRDLYHKRVPDVRFLIPVLIGLNKVSLPADS